MKPTKIQSKTIRAWAVVCSCCGKLYWIQHGVFGKTTARIYKTKKEAYNGALEDDVVPVEIILPKTKKR